MGMMLTASPSEVQAPPLEFESHDSLQAWAKESAFDEGRVYRLGPAALGLYCADRSHTSGVYSSELALYVRKDGSYRLVLYLPSSRYFLAQRFFRPSKVAWCSDNP
jgi:hypothetical protein